MKKYYKLLSICLIAIVSMIAKVDAIKAWTPRGRYGSNPDVSTDYHVDGQYSIFDLISLVNGYLRFAIGFVCFLFMVWNGYQLIIARGDEKEMKKATGALTGCAIGLVVCILAYIIVNIAVKLF